jgi:hypothetical protein
MPGGASGVANCDAVGPGCSIEDSIYGYAPTLWVNVFLLVFFSLTGITHVFQAIRYKTVGFGIAMFWGHVALVLGYIGRIWLRSNVYALNPFLIQIICLTLAPAFLSAAIYLCLSRIILVVGEGHSRFPARYYTIVFCVCDFISLCLQGAGGGLASTSSQAHKPTTTGDDVTTAGLVFQVFTLTVFAIAIGDYALRSAKARAQLSPQFEEVKHSIKFNGFLVALGVSFTAIYIRCVYRIVELSSGWGSALQKDELLFVILEGVMICVAVVVLNVFHPGFCFPLGYVPGLKKKTGKQSALASDDDEKDVV